MPSPAPPAPRPNTRTATPSATAARDQTQQDVFATIQCHVERNDLEVAAQLLNQLPLDTLDASALLSVHALALQLAIDRTQYEEAMKHADAALDLTNREPLVYHLLGRALWATGDTRYGAEAIVRAAELLQTREEDTQPPQLPLDALSVYFMAGEACQYYEQYEAALTFFQQAARFAPDPTAITDAIANVESARATSNKAS